jgi:hypothetical protein
MKMVQANRAAPTNATESFDRRMRMFKSGYMLPPTFVIWFYSASTDVLDK